MFFAEKNDSIENFDYDFLRNSNIYYRETEAVGYDVYVSGNYAYIADNWKGLAIIDISDPTNPGTPIYMDLHGITWAQAVYVSGNYAYVAYNGITESGLAIIDISDPEHPLLPVYVNTEFAWDVYVSGNYAYVADDNNGLAIIDISDPTNPGTPVNRTTYDVAYGVYVSGNYAYVADGNAGLTVIDVSDPTSPGSPVNKDTNGLAKAIYISGNDAYVAVGSAGLAYIDVSNPNNPGSPVYEDTYSAIDVFVIGDYAYTIDIYGMGLIDIIYPPFPNQIVYKDIEGYTRGICIEGNYAYISGSVGLAVIDISKERAPLIKAYKPSGGEARKICIEGNYAFIADDSAGLAIIPVIEPIHPTAPVYRDTNGLAMGVDVDGNYVFVADGNAGLAVIRVSAPTSPGSLYPMDTTGFAWDVEVSGDYAYLACGSSGLAVIDISDPTNPGLPVYRPISTGMRAYGIFISGDYAYLAVGDFSTLTGGLAVIDISDPTSPGAPHYEWTSGVAEAVFLSGDYAYVSVDRAGLDIIGVSNPLNPALINTISTAGIAAMDVYVSGDYAYIADGDRLTIIDIKVPWVVPTPVYSDIIDTCLGVYVDGDYAYMASRSEGLVVVQIRERADLDDPIITENSSDLILECGYTGKNILWTATDDNPYNYTIELQGSGIVTGPTTWSSGVAVIYDIPDGLGVGIYTYIINFTDDNGNFATDTVVVTVQDTENPVIIFTPADKIVGLGYSGVNFQWTATDENPYNYTIELQGSGTVTGPTSWSSGIPIVYNVPEGFSIGEYFYTINFTDDYGYFIIETVKLTIQDIEDPIITDAPSDIAVELGYTGVNLQWNATDDNPNTYTIELQGFGIVAGPTAWFSGVAVNYGIPNGFPLGEYYYIINYTDDYKNFIIDTIKFTVGDSVNPVITDAPEDYSCFSGYTDISLFWIATDAHPATYTVALQGSGIVAGPTSWTSGNNVSYTIPEGLSVGEHFFTINFTDLAGNFVIDTVKITVKEDTPVVDDPQIPFGNWYLIFLGISIIALVLIQKRKR
ncbi:MAG: LVIVD repeat-containing protein [Promethearchaeota archaeon]